MDALGSLIKKLEGMVTNGDELTHIQNLLKQNEDVLARNTDKLEDVLGAVDPARQSLVWLYIIDTQSQELRRPAQIEAFLKKTAHFLHSCSADQIQLAPEKFTAVCRRFKDHLISSRHPERAILPLQAAICKLQPSSQFLTPQHGDFVQVCLLAKCYKAALPVLEDDHFEVDVKKTGVTPKDFLQYCYYGGIIYVGLKQFSRALDFFHHAISAPASVLNAITVAAYKKYVAASLIANGQVPPFAKYTPSIVQRHLKSSCQEYIELSTAFATRSIEDLQQCITSHEQVFRDDNNLGLVKQCVASLHKRNIQRLTQTYLTLSLQDIATSVKLAGPKQAELHVLRMIEDGEIFATINQKDGMVRFQEDPERYNSREMSERLDSNIQSMIQLAKKVASVEEEISRDKAYLSKVSMKDRHSRFGDPDDFDIGGPSQRILDPL